MTFFFYKKESFLLDIYSTIYYTVLTNMKGAQTNDNKN